MTNAEVKTLRRRLLDKAIPLDVSELVAKLLDHAMKVEQDRELLLNAYHSVLRGITPNALLGR